MPSPARIDVHQHLFTEEFLAAEARRGLRSWTDAPWSPEGAIAMMDEVGIATGVLSLSTPGTHLGDDAEARILTRQVNERIAEVVQSRPDRFGMFASVPLPDVDGALEAIAHAYDNLSADGVILYANMAGTYMGAPAFDPVMEELNRRNALILVHPGPLPGKPIDGIFPPLADFLLDTMRAAINMQKHGILRRFPNIKIILSHGGGFLPYAVYRIANTLNAVDQSVNVAAVVEEFKSFYFDIALTSTPTALPALLAFAKPGHVLFGSDWPYMPVENSRSFLNCLNTFEGLDDAGRSAINRGNAEVLIPRLSEQKA
jgi:6-methylsalicylate decarboxylase